jgi:hypothetical protein
VKSPGRPTLAAVRRNAEGYLYGQDYTPRTPTELMAILSGVGWRSTDIRDALDAADVAYLGSAGNGIRWSELHDAELATRRTPADVDHQANDADLDAIARFGHDYVSLGDVGPGELFNRLRFDPQVASAAAIRRVLSRHPDWVIGWFGYAHSRRHVMPGWHLGHRRDAHGNVTGAYVSWVRVSDSEPRASPSREFLDESLGAAEFARLEMERLAGASAT